MSSVFDTFEKKHDYLVCVDSDGCAMDTMDIKHFRCFGPCMVDEWHLEAWRDEILERWNVINLYSMTRGINRFKGLAMHLKEINDTYTQIDGIDALCDWAENANELSNTSVEKMARETGNNVFLKALNWSKMVNANIAKLPQELKKPFPGADEGLKAAHAIADVCVVSSANKDAVEEEWAMYGMLDSVDLLCCQDAGSKAYCIAQLLLKGYDPAKVLMVGDAPGDQAAAKKNGVNYYPILVRHEGESWAELKEKGLAMLQEGYAAYGKEKEEQFFANLKG